MLIPIILSGGAGTRLWPISRESHPKPFMKLADGQSLLQKTYARALQLPGVETVLTITNREYYFKTKDEYAGFTPEYPVIKNSFPIKNSFLLEPVGRNTAPAIALAAVKIAETHGEDTLMLVMPADHLIENQQAFITATTRAQQLAQQDHLATFGIIPYSPETGLGYIERGDPCKEGTGYTVTRFVEKPTAELAQEYINTGRYYWNSGMFCFKAGTILQQFKLHAPALYEQAKACWLATQQQTENNFAISEIDATTFAELPDISIDYAVMEHAKNIVVVPSDFTWSDIGCWHAVSNLAAPDSRGNRIVGDARLVDVDNTYIQSEDRLVAAIGLENLIIVDTPDALLIAKRDRVQEVRKIVAQLKHTQHESYKIHRTVVRPWGSYSVLEEGKNFKIKRIVVKPAASLSLQVHHHRSEHWVVVSGVAHVVNGERNYEVKKNESTYIPAGCQHRLENLGAEDLVLIEVQSGEYLGEDDIVRLEDKYGRVESLV